MMVTIFLLLVSLCVVPCLSSGTGVNEESPTHSTARAIFNPFLNTIDCTNIASSSSLISVSKPNDGIQDLEISPSSPSPLPSPLHSDSVKSVELSSPSGGARKNFSFPSTNSSNQTSPHSTPTDSRRLLPKSDTATTHIEGRDSQTLSFIETNTGDASDYIGASKSSPRPAPPKGLKSKSSKWCPRCILL